VLAPTELENSLMEINVVGNFGRKIGVLARTTLASPWIQTVRPSRAMKSCILPRIFFAQTPAEYGKSGKSG
jgi:hypothetical protein